MIIVRSPLRISLGGGGTDLPSYYKNHGGFLIAAAIDRYVYITLHKTFVPDCIIKYSEIERVSAADDIKHPIIREALRLTKTDIHALEIASMADVHAGTGLGSSGSFTTALLKALHYLKRESIGPRLLAEEACHIEIDLLKEPIGKQDQYIAAYGGINAFVFHSDGGVEVEPLKLHPQVIEDMEDNLLLFFTGQSRSAGQILADQDKRTRESDKKMLENLHYIKQIGLKSRECLEAGSLEQYADLLNEHWNWKRRRTGVNTEDIEFYYSLGMKNGALGGKLVGAGGGGFLLFLAHDPKQLRKTMMDAGLPEVRFRFDFQGTKAIIG